MWRSAKYWCEFTDLVQTTDLYPHANNLQPRPVFYDILSHADRFFAAIYSIVSHSGLVFIVLADKVEQVYQPIQGKSGPHATKRSK